MSGLTLWRVDDAVHSHTLHRGGERIGEIRWNAMHAHILQLGEADYWLVHQESAAAVEAGGSLLSSVIGKLRLNRTYILRDGDTDLARATRHWKPLRNRDWIELHLPGGDASLQAVPKGMFGGQIDLRRGVETVGHVRVVGLWRNGVSLDCPGLPEPQAALLMLAIQCAWGNDPFVRAPQP